MGGYGSGGHNRKHDYTGRYKALDSFYFGKYIPKLKQGGWETVDSFIRWKDGGEIGIDLTANYLGVRYSSGAEEIREKLYFDAVPNNYGGADRVYFICPHCGRRSRMLYLHHRHFKCRKCSQLNYRSQQTSKGWETAVYKLAKFLKTNFKIVNLAPCEAEIITPPRPKGMHEQTYNKLLRELETLQNTQRNAFMTIVGRFGITI